MTDTITLFEAYPADLREWTDEQSAEFGAWVETHAEAHAETPPTFSTAAAADRYAELLAAALAKPPAKKPRRSAPGADDLVWIVSRAKGLHTVAAAETDAVLGAGARLATDRDLKIAGVER